MSIEEYFDANGFSSRKESGKSWTALGEMFNITDEAARSRMRRHWAAKAARQEHLVLRSEWQAQGKGGEVITLRSYRNQPELTQLTREDIEEVILKHMVLRDEVELVPRDNAMVAELEVHAIGDVHIGMCSEDNQFHLHWNLEELYKRADKVVDSIRDQDAVQCLVFGGDICDGQHSRTTRGLKGSSGHQLPQSLGDKEQIDESCRFITYLLDKFSARCRQVRCLFVCNSNHGGILDYAVGRIMEAVCPHRYPGRVHWQNQLAFMECREFGNHLLAVTHGYDEQYLMRSWPRFLGKEHERFVEKVMRMHPGNGKNRLLLRFDLHQYTDVRYDYFRDIVCPAFSNPSSWVSLNFGSDYKGGYVKLHLGESNITKELIEF